MTAITPVQVAQLITEPDMCPSLADVIRRTRAGDPYRDDYTVEDVLAVLPVLTAAIARTYARLGRVPAAPVIPVQATRKEVKS